jgi:site-specific recombinase XerD
VADALTPYYRRPKYISSEERRRDGKPGWVRFEFNLFPIVLDKWGIPWGEAMVYLISRLEGKANPSMATFSSIADDLTAYRHFLDENQIDWTDFSGVKLKRPTYRFNGHLKYRVGAGEMAVATAKRRMSAVVAFYRWLETEDIFKPEASPWVEKDAYINYADSRGLRRHKIVKSTDLSIGVAKQDDPYSGTIDDGGKLRPLLRQEQDWLIDALMSIGNTEMTLIHLCALLTGARIQTVLTLRVRNTFLEVPKKQETEVRVPVGYGTGVDTKFNKQMSLLFPQYLYQRLRTYVKSDRARIRREKAIGGDSDDQYLFLSHRGTPLYRCKEQSNEFDAENSLRHAKQGQAVRQFIRERVIPLVQSMHDAKDFNYRYHDLRATAGMNWSDDQLKLVAEGKISLQDARNYVSVRLGHDSWEVTDRYLQFRHRAEQVRWAERRHEDHLRQLCERALSEGV